MKTIAAALFCFAAMTFTHATAHADPYCFVPIGQYKNTCDPTYLRPQTSGSNNVPGTWGPDGQYTPCTASDTRYC